MSERKRLNRAFNAYDRNIDINVEIVDLSEILV
jgi:Ca2+-binding EF-hand superfamily protein